MIRQIGWPTKRWPTIRHPAPGPNSADAPVKLFHGEAIPATAEPGTILDCGRHAPGRVWLGSRGVHERSSHPARRGSRWPTGHGAGTISPDSSSSEAAPPAPRIHGSHCPGRTGLPSPPGGHSRRWTGGGATRARSASERPGAGRHRHAECWPMPRPPEAATFVNARPDIAAALGAQGVQLGGADLSPRDARKIYPDGWIGASVHT